MKYAGQTLRLAYWMDSCSRSGGIENENQTLNQITDCFEGASLEFLQGHHHTWGLGWKHGSQ